MLAKTFCNVIFNCTPDLVAPSSYPDRFYVWQNGPHSVEDPGTEYPEPKESSYKYELG